MEDEHLCNPWDLDSEGTGIQVVWCRVCGRRWAPHPDTAKALLCHACHKRKPVRNHVLCGACLDKWIEDTEDTMKVIRVYGGYGLDPKPSFVRERESKDKAVAASKARRRPQK